MDTDKWKQIAEAVWRLADMEKRLGDDSITEDEMVATCDDIMDSMRALASDPERTCGGCEDGPDPNECGYRRREDCGPPDWECWQPREGGDDDDPERTCGGCEQWRELRGFDDGRCAKFRETTHRNKTNCPSWQRREGGDAPTCRACAHQLTVAMSDCPCDLGPTASGECVDAGHSRWQPRPPAPDEPECALAEEMERHLADLHETGRSIDHSALKTGVLGACSYLYELVPKVRTLAADLARVTGERDEWEHRWQQQWDARIAAWDKRDEAVKRAEHYQQQARNRLAANHRQCERMHRFSKDLGEARSRAEAAEAKVADLEARLGERTREKLDLEADVPKAAQTIAKLRHEKRDLEARLGRAVWELPHKHDRSYWANWCKSQRAATEHRGKVTGDCECYTCEGARLLASAIEAAPEPAKPAGIAAPAGLVEWLREYVREVPDSLDETACNLRSLLAILKGVNATLVTREMWEAARRIWIAMAEWETVLYVASADLPIPEEWVAKEESDSA